MSFIQTHRDRWGVEPICRVLQVAPATYYAARRRPPSVRALRDAQLKVEIARVHKNNFQVYGDLKEALRMRPDRLILGEVRQEECLDLLIAFNSGIPGMTSVHANSAREALVKLTTLPLLAGVILSR